MLATKLEDICKKLDESEDYSLKFEIGPLVIKKSTVDLFSMLGDYIGHRYMVYIEGTNFLINVGSVEDIVFKIQEQINLGSILMGIMYD